MLGNNINKQSTPCPACYAKNTKFVYSIKNIPVQSCVLLDSEEEARDYPTRDLELAACENCGLVFNRIFDEEIMDYTSKTEESQHFSGTFSRFAKKLAEEISQKCDLEGKSVLEIGCGKGDFLKEFCSLKPCTGLGIDPGYYENKDRVEEEGDNVEFIVDYFGPKYAYLNPDIILCRHTLEHVGKPASFVKDIRDCIGNNSDVSIFFETPDAERVITEGAFWDIYYEHCNYFTQYTHAQLFRREGFEVTEVGLMYDDQYIYQYAVPSDVKETEGQEEELNKIRSQLAAFPEKIQQVQDHWKSLIYDYHAQGKKIAIWGGGSKCVAFLTTLSVGDEITWVVDINPFKQGKYVPGSGHQVASPEDLAANSVHPDLVIVMNPIYVNEITAQLNSMNVHPKILAL